jgi:hypothetical protein
MVKGRRYRLVYSRRYPFDTRVYTGAEEIYTPCEKLARAIFLSKGFLEEAKSRVKSSKGGRFYQYTPSKEYLKALNKFHSH